MVGRESTSLEQDGFPAQFPHFWEGLAVAAVKSSQGSSVRFERFADRVGCWEVATGYGIAICGLTFLDGLPGSRPFIV